METSKELQISVCMQYFDSLFDYVNKVPYVDWAKKNLSTKTFFFPIVFYKVDIA